jgi:SAM-dependent methyltransferase
MSGTLSSARRDARKLRKVVARGLAEPEMRKRYLQELRSRLTREDAPTRAPGKRKPKCLICGSRRLGERTVTYTGHKKKKSVVWTCKACGFLHMPGHVESRYKAKTDIEELPAGHSRLGDIDVPGREFHMAKMAIDILGGSGHEVLVYGAGRSLDNHHIAKLPEVKRVAIGDIMKLRDDAEFIDANDPPRRRFSVVVASEVIEHFRDPHEDFKKLFRLVKRDGLVVCGTNIYDGGPLEGDWYIQYPDHTAYYTPEVLRRIANRAGVHLDFRAPLTGQAMRKRYVIFTRSGEVMESVACYFGREVYAPSEIEHPDRPIPQRSHQTWRRSGSPGAEAEETGTEMVGSVAEG